MIHPFELLTDPVRRRIVEVLAVGDHRAGEIADVVSFEFGISRTAVSHRLRTLRDQGVVTSAVDSSEPRARRYRLDAAFLARLDDAVGHLFELWDHRYGSAERRAPIPPSTPTRPSRVHRLGDSAARRAEGMSRGGRASRREGSSPGGAQSIRCVPPLVSCRGGLM